VHNHPSVGDGPAVRLFTRRRHDWTKRYPAILPVCIGPIPIVEAPTGRRDEFVDPYFERAKPDAVDVSNSPGFYSHITPGSVSLRLSALAARLHSRHRVIGRRRLSEAPLARTVRSNDILQVADAAGEPVDAGDHQHVPFSQEIEHGAQLRAVRRAGA
jgi:hypothetical protein